MRKEQDKTKTSDAFLYSRLRMIWLMSRERAAAMKREGYCCERCKRKQSKKKGFEVKINVHHKNRITNWKKIYEVLRKEMLINPSELEVLCRECHMKEHMIKRF